MQQFFKKKKRIQSSLEEWENSGLEKLAQEDAAREQAAIKETGDYQEPQQKTNEHPLATNVEAKRDAYKEAVDALDHAEYSLRNGHGDALKRDLYQQFWNSAEKREDEHTMQRDTQDRYAEILQRVGGLESSINQLQETVSQLSQSRSAEEILQDAQTEERPAIEVNDNQAADNGLENEMD